MNNKWMRNQTAMYSNDPILNAQQPPPQMLFPDSSQNQIPDGIRFAIIEAVSRRPGIWNSQKRKMEEQTENGCSWRLPKPSANSSI
ncbi:unnamed protein product [Caenorhabditis bovis]|uniref:Uncharacterized protein n=1 Tax=Caenorhabditis bovis TaxID=2654633 RepID=A0A8S1F7S3_9PELO|nr:unnamed protein product [Caenorhabditis bovis]